MVRYVAAPLPLARPCAQHDAPPVAGPRRGGSSPRGRAAAAARGGGAPLRPRGTIAIISMGSTSSVLIGLKWSGRSGFVEVAHSDRHLFLDIAYIYIYMSEFEIWRGRLGAFRTWQGRLGAFRAWRARLGASHTSSRSSRCVSGSSRCVVDQVQRQCDRLDPLSIINHRLVCLGTGDALAAVM